jgi:hypothetical protein
VQTHLEGMLTRNASDIGAMLAGVREHHDTLVSALEGEPAAAASLADSGVLNALQVGAGDFVPSTVLEVPWHCGP